MRTSKHIMLLWVLTVVLNFWAKPACTQDLEQDFARMAQVYQQAEAYDIKLDFKLYPTYQSPNAVESGNARVVRKDGQYYSKQFYFEMVVNEDYVLLVDHDSKVVMIDRNRPHQQQLSSGFVMTLDSLVEQMRQSFGAAGPLVEKKQYQKVDARTAAWTLHYSRGAYEKQTLFFDPETYQVKKAVLYYREALPIVPEQGAAPPRLEINYVAMDLDPDINHNQFALDRFVQINAAHELTLQAGLEDYQVINHLIDP